jgi:hypothetical protein
MKDSQAIRATPKVPRGRRGKAPHDDKLNQATADDFEREGRGVAPKE